MGDSWVIPSVTSLTDRSVCKLISLYVCVYIKNDNTINCVVSGGSRSVVGAVAAARNTMPTVQGTIHILRKHIFGIFVPPLPHPYVSMFLVLKISKNWHFLTPPPPPLRNR